jgi:hypothetical protein
MTDILIRMKRERRVAVVIFLLLLGLLGLRLSMVAPPAEEPIITQTFVMDATP